MSKRFSVILILLLVITGVGAMIYIGTRKKPVPGAAPGALSTRVLGPMIPKLPGNVKRGSEYAKTIMDEMYLLHKAGIATVADSATISYAKGEITDSAYVRQWIQAAEDTGITVLAKQQMIDYFDDKLTPDQYLSDWIDAAQVADTEVLAADALRRYFAGQIDYAEYIRLYQRALESE